jgi:hypothetical protein
MACVHARGSKREIGRAQTTLTGYLPKIGWLVSMSGVHMSGTKSLCGAPQTNSVESTLRLTQDATSINFITFHLGRNVGVQLDNP